MQRGTRSRRVRIRIGLVAAIIVCILGSGCGSPSGGSSGGSEPSAGSVTVESITPLTPREVAVDEIVVDNYNPAATFEPFGGLVFNPKARADKLAGEIRITPVGPGHWAVLVDGLEMAAERFSAVRLTLSPSGPGEPRPAHLFWLRDADMRFQDVLTPEFLATGGFPFVVRQSVRFEPAEENTWVARTSGHARWSGTITKLCISLAFSPKQSDEAGGYPPVGLRKLEFLAERYASPEE